MDNSLFRISVFNDGEIVGMARVLGDKGLCYYIKDVYIKPAYQGKGIGRLLVDEIMKYINENGIAETNISVELAVLPDKIPY